MKKDHRVTITFLVKAKEPVDRVRLRTALKNEWYLESGSGTLPLGVKEGYKPVRYGRIDVRVR